MNSRQKVTNRLLKLCEDRRLTLNALANRSAVPPSTLKSIINGDSKNPGIVLIGARKTDGVKNLGVCFNCALSNDKLRLDMGTFDIDYGEEGCELYHGIQWETSPLVFV